MPLSIRVAAKNDIQAIVNLFSITRGELAQLTHEGCTGTIMEKQLFEDLLAEFKERLEDDSCLAYVAENEHGLAGFITAAVESCSDELIGAPFLTIEFVETAPTARGQGVATALISVVEKWAVEHEIEFIDLLVWDSNIPAAKLYEKLGYSTLERRMVKRVG